jgi:hypothetical protein
MSLTVGQHCAVVDAVLLVEAHCLHGARIIHIRGADDMETRKLHYKFLW